MALLKLSDKYTVARLESACERALSYTSHPSFKNVQAILKSGQDKLSEDANNNHSNASDYGITRGADYYRGDDKC